MDEFLALEKPLPPTSVRSMRTCTIDYFGWETSDIFSLQISGVKKNDECPDGDLKTSGHVTETLYSLNLDPNNFDNAAFTELVQHFFGLNLENEDDVATIKRMIDFGMLLELDENHVPLVRFPFLQMPAFSAKPSYTPNGPMLFQSISFTETTRGQFEFKLVTTQNEELSWTYNTTTHQGSLKAPAEGITHDILTQLPFAADLFHTANTIYQAATITGDFYYGFLYATDQPDVRLRPATQITDFTDGGDQVSVTLAGGEKITATIPQADKNRELVSLELIAVTATQSALKLEYKREGDTQILIAFPHLEADGGVTWSEFIVKLEEDRWHNAGSNDPFPVPFVDDSLQALLDSTLAPRSSQ